MMIYIYIWFSLWCIFLLICVFGLFLLVALLRTYINKSLLWFCSVNHLLVLHYNLIPYLVLDIVNKRIYCLAPVFSGYLATYCYKLFGIVKCSSYLYSWHDFGRFAEIEIYWSPVYNELQKILRDISHERLWRKSTYRFYWFISLLLFIILFFLHIYLDFLLQPYYILLRLLLLVMLIVLRIYILPRSAVHSLFSDELFVSRFLGRLIYFLLQFLNYLPLLFIRLFTVLLNIFIVYTLCDFFNVSSVFWSTFLSYNIIILLFMLIRDVLLLLVPSSFDWSRVNITTIFIFPLGVVVLYFFYSIWWWLRFIYKAYKIGDVRMVFRYVYDYRKQSTNSSFGGLFWPIYRANFEAMLWHYTPYYEYQSFSRRKFYGFPLINPYIRLLCEGYVENSCLLMCVITSSDLRSIFATQKLIHKLKPECSELIWVQGARSYQWFMRQYLEIIDKEARKQNDGG